MALILDCNTSGALSAVYVDEDCPEQFGQIQKILFTRKYSTGTTLNGWLDIGGTPTPADPNLLASWNAETLDTSPDGTFIIPSPFVENPENEPGEMKTFGGGNQTRWGIEIVIGKDPTVFTGVFNQVRQETIADLKGLQGQQLAVYLIDEHGRIGGLSESTVSEGGTPAELYPIPIYQLAFGDKKFGGFEEPDSNTITFKMSPNWSDLFYIFNPSGFNALDIVRTSA